MSIKNERDSEFNCWLDEEEWLNMELFLDNPSQHEIICLPKESAIKLRDYLNEILK